MILEPESEQIREVYAFFGLAMYQAQNLERALAMLLAVFGDSKRMTAWDYDAQLAENFQSTFGALVTKFAGLSGSDYEGLRRELEKALTDRNELAHHYFWDRAVQFCVSEGRAQMIEELASLRDGFESLDVKLSELTRGIVHQRGLTKEKLRTQIDVEMQNLLSCASESYRPERVPNPVELVTAYEWRTGSAVKNRLVLASRDEKFLVLGETGLCYGPQDIPANELFVKPEFARALPAAVNPRPKKSTPWNFVIPLANGYALRARPDEEHGRPVCRFTLRKIK